MTNDQYSPLLTEDGSITLKASEFDEAMHSCAGAYEESIVKYVRASHVLEKKGNEISVLDVGFGIGYNMCALLHEWNKLKEKPFLTIYSLEKNKSVSSFIETLSFPDERNATYEKVKAAFRCGKYEEGNVKIEFLFGDARQSIQKLEEQGILFDGIFQDAFSPGKNPELWTLDYFKILKHILKNDGILCTYSSAPQIRRAIFEAGLKIAMAPSTGLKKEGTLASLSAELDYFPARYIGELCRNYKSTVFRDEILDSPREYILNRRIKEMAEIRRNHLSYQDH